MVLRVQNLMPYSLAGEKGGKVLGLLYGHRSYKDRLSFRMGRRYFLRYGLPFVRLVQVDLIILVDSCHRLVRRNRNDIQAVYFVEFNGLGRRRTGHSGELAVHTEKILERDCRHRPVALGYADMLLRLYRLMQAVGIASSLKDTPREFIHNLNLAVPDYVVHVVVEKPVGAQRLGEVVRILKILLVHERTLDQIVLMEYRVYMVHSLIREGNTL